MNCNDRGDSHLAQPAFIAELTAHPRVVEPPGIDGDGDLIGRAYRVFKTDDKHEFLFRIEEDTLIIRVFGHGEAPARKDEFLRFVSRLNAKLRSCAIGLTQDERFVVSGSAPVQAGGAEVAAIALKLFDAALRVSDELQQALLSAHLQDVDITGREAEQVLRHLIRPELFRCA